VREPGRLLAGLPAEQTCWMSHRDTVFEPPPGLHGARVVDESPVAAFEDVERGLYGIQFHPEVVHTPYGTGDPHDVPRRRLRLRHGRGAPASVIEEQVERIRAQVGDGA
jgi:GMP synthase (glutamine-hydrolysing)